MRVAPSAAPSSPVRPSTIRDRFAGGALRCEAVWLVLTTLAALLVSLLAPLDSLAQVTIGDRPPRRGAPLPPRVAGAVATAPLAELRALEDAFRSVADQVAPAVVGIRACRRCATAEGDSAVREQVVLVNGSGVILTSDGRILTNEHVIQSATSIEVIFHDGTSALATVHAADPRSDLAVLQVARSDLPIARYCDWSQVTRGQWIVVLGNPVGLGSDGRLSLSTGVLANFDRRLPGLGENDDRLYHDMLQVTAAIHPGNSGGPLFNLSGELVGIVTAMHTRAAADEGIGFAIPLSPLRRRLISRLLDGEVIEYAYLGVTVRTAPAVAGEPRGVLIDVVEPDGPAAAAGVLEGDRLVRLDGWPLESTGALADRMAQTPVGARVMLGIVRGAERLELRATVARRELARVNWMRGGALLWRGLRLADVDPGEEAAADGVAARGVIVVEVLHESPGEAAGLRRGDIIEQVGSQPISELAALRPALRGLTGDVVLVCRSRGRVVVGP